MTETIRSMLSPRRVAVVGASSGDRDAWSFNARITRAVLASALEDVLLVSRSTDTIAGRPCVQSLRGQGFGADLAVLAVRAGELESVIEDCIAEGVRTGLILTAAMSPAAAAAVDRAREQGMRFIGPNCIGFLDNVQGISIFAGGIVPTASSADGGVAMISQSGGFTSAVIGAGLGRGLTFTHVYTTGDELDLRLEDCLEVLIESGTTRMIALFVEAVRDPLRFRRLCRRALNLGIILAVVRVGRTSAAREVALAHTGALVSDWDANTAALAADGVIDCQSVEEVLDLASLARRVRHPLSGRVELITSSGALGALAVDRAGERGLALTPPSATLTSQIIADSSTTLRNPYDTSVGGGTVATLRRVLEMALPDAPGDPRDSLLFCHTGATYDTEIAELLGQLQKRNLRTIVVAWPGVGDAANEILQDAGICTFDETDRGLRALGRLAARPAAPLEVTALPQANPHSSSALSRALSYLDARARGTRWGVPTPPYAVVLTNMDEDLVAPGSTALRMLTPPLVVKMAEGANHKAAAGGVVLGLASTAAAATAVGRFVAAGYLERVIIEEQVATGTEVLVDVRRSSCGDVLTVGWGGSATEQINDVAVVSEPFTVDAVRAALARTRVARRLAATLADAEPATRQLTDLCLLLTQVFAVLPELAEIEINPVIVTDAGVIAADIRVIEYLAAEA